jgi:hypothetical protein
MSRREEHFDMGSEHKDINAVFLNLSKEEDDSYVNKKSGSKRQIHRETIRQESSDNTAGVGGVHLPIYIYSPLPQEVHIAYIPGPFRVSRKKKSISWCCQVLDCWNPTFFFPSQFKEQVLHAIT